MKKRSMLINVLCLFVLMGTMVISCDNGNGGDPTPTPAVVNATWTFNGGSATITALPTATFTGSIALSSDIAIACDAGGTGATFKLLAGEDNKPKYNAGIQQNTGTKKWDFAEITIDAPCTISVKAKYAGAYDVNKVRSFSIGDQSFSMASTDLNSDLVTLTYTATAAGSYKIIAGGMKFIELSCSNQQ